MGFSSNVCDRRHHQDLPLFTELQKLIALSSYVVSRVAKIQHTRRVLCARLQREFELASVTVRVGGQKQQFSIVKQIVKCDLWKGTITSQEIEDLKNREEIRKRVGENIGNVGQNIHPQDSGPPLMLDLNLMCSVVGPTRFGQGRVGPVGVEPDEVGPFFKLFSGTVLYGFFLD